MERISHLIEKIRATYYQNREKTLIDLDLLLDYTRVMYADLLEWRADLEPSSGRRPEPESTEKRAPAADVVPESAPPGVLERNEEPAFTGSRPEAPDAGAQPENKMDTGTETITSQDHSVAEAGSTETAFSPAEQSPPQKAAESEGTEKEGEEEPNKLVERMKNDRSSISFEPPSAAPAPGNVQKGDDLPEQPVEEMPVSGEAAKVAGSTKESQSHSAENPAQQLPVSPPVHKEPASEGSEEPAEIRKDQKSQNTGKPAETISPAGPKIPESPAREPLPDFKKIFEKANATGPEEKRDIRKLIGINDKYLFLNELFNNHKSEYEETLDHLNKMDSAAAAREFLENEIAPKYKWLGEDATVESFYWVVERHLKR